MDIQFFDDGDLVPQPKDKVFIEDLKASPYPDGQRVYLEINVTPFQERPNLIVVARDSKGTIAAELNIIETMHYNMEFTLHIRNVEETAGAYALSVDLFYDTRTPPQDQKSIEFTIPAE